MGGPLASLPFSLSSWFSFRPLTIHELSRKKVLVSSWKRGGDHCPLGFVSSSTIFKLGMHACPPKPAVGGCPFLRDVNECLFSYGVFLFERAEMGSFSSCVEADLRGDPRPLFFSDPLLLFLYPPLLIGSCLEVFFKNPKETSLLSALKWGPILSFFAS